MLIGMLFTVAIICILVVGPSFDNVMVAIAIYGGIILGMIVLWWYSSKWTGGITDFFMGVSGGKAKETYHLAEKYEIEHNYEAAMDVYRKAIEKDKKNPEPRTKLADLYHKLGDFDKCVKYMEESLALSRSMSAGERVAVLNRIADLHLHSRNDPASAISVLRRIVKDFPDTKFALNARERMVNIKRDHES